MTLLSHFAVNHTHANMRNLSNFVYQDLYIKEVVNPWQLGLD